MSARENRIMRIAMVIGAALALSAVGCGGGASGKGALTPGQDSGKKSKDGQAVSKEAAAGFDRALDSFAGHDKKGDWAESSCGSVAQEFLAASKAQQAATGKPLAEALYNAGLAYQRCDKDAEARAQFQAAASADAAFHRAKAQLALYDFEKSKNVEGTIATLEQIIRDAKFQNVEALVSLAALQLERNNDSSDQDGKNDMERAKKNLQRALAIDDSYMAAFNQLAIFYLEQAKAKADADAARRGRKRRGLVAASTKSRDVNQQQLDLAALVASQGVRKNPNYAPLHNTAGLIQVELKNFNGAVKSFGAARRLDSKFFEAHMNYAAVNLGFRGFGEAEKAYRDALKLRPKEYEAHLGLALAIRGQARPGDTANITKAQAALDEAKKLEPGRAETYYNEAILIQEFRTKGSEKDAIPMFEKAAATYKQFIDKAGAAPEFADAVKRAKERSQDIEDTVKFIKEGEAAKNAPPPPPPPADGAGGAEKK
jgi:tetratricopeptide (TPR) repeat protein